MPAEMVALDGYVLTNQTERAIGIVKVGIEAFTKGNLVWVPRSLVEDEGETLAGGDTDIVVAEWFAEREGLDY